MSVLDVLAEKALLDKKDIPSIEADAAKSGEGLEVVLEKRGVELVDYLESKGEYYGLPSRILDGQDISFEILK